MSTVTASPYLSDVDRAHLVEKVQALYRTVAERPDAELHFRTGRDLAEQLGYPADVLDAVPTEAVASFAGVGYFFDLAALSPGERVLDLGSGAGTDAFVASVAVGDGGRVTGVDMTDAQLAKAERLRAAAGWDQVDFLAGRIEDLPCPEGSVDVVISNGVINLAPDKDRVFAEAARVLRPGGRLALADIVTDEPLTEQIVCDVDLWASCIGGAPQRAVYLGALEGAGFRVEVTRANDYEFVTDQARRAGRRYGVHSVSVLARRT